MAHSNRKKLRDARGGLTRNQAKKARNQSTSISPINRLAETVKWMEENEARRMNKTSEKPMEEKVVTYIKNKKTTQRRKKVLHRLEEQLKKGTKIEKQSDVWNEVPLVETDIKRINKEIQIVKSRI